MLKWIDVLKGIGIIAVVAGHVFDGFFSKFIFTFHMPLFFFVSGFLFKIRYDEKIYFISKFKHFLIPYFSFLVLLYVPSACLQIYHAGFDSDEVLKAIARGLIGGRDLAGLQGVFWFVTCLFIVQQLVNALAVRFSMRWIGGLMLVFLVGAYANSILLPWLWLPWNANVVLMAAPLFYFGWLAKAKNLEIPTVLSVVGVSISVGLLLLGVDSSIDMKHSIYGIPVLAILSALCAIQLLVNLSKKISEFKFLSSFFGVFGDASMMIMYCHQPIQIIMRDKFGILDNATRFFTALVISLLLYKGASIFRATRFFLLGISHGSDLNLSSVNKTQRAS